MKLRTLIVLGLVLTLASPVVAQKTVSTAPPDAAASSELVQAVQEVELDKMRKQIADLQRQLREATADERTAAAKKGTTDLSERVKKEYGEACSKGGGKWTWLQGVIDNQAVTFIGCTGK